MDTTRRAMAIGVSGVGVESGLCERVCTRAPHAGAGSKSSRSGGAAPHGRGEPSWSRRYAAESMRMRARMKTYRSVIVPRRRFRRHHDKSRSRVHVHLTNRQDAQIASHSRSDQIHSELLCRFACILLRFCSIVSKADRDAIAFYLLHTLRARASRGARPGT